MPKPSTLVSIALICLSGIVLLTMLAYPLAYDQSVFAVGGELSFKHGAVAYRDFIDTKPQLIFWIYGFSSFIFGHHEWAIRAFDILYHVVSLFFFYRILRTVLKNKQIAFLSVILYVIVLVASGFNQTAQAETFAFLPSILLFYRTELAAEGKDVLKNGVYAGIAAGILFLLKFTFITASAAAILYLFMRSSTQRKNFWRYVLGHGISIITILGIFFSYLWATDSLPRFFESMHWLAGYSSLVVPVSGIRAVEVHFKMYPAGLLGEYGMTFIVLAIIGARYFVKNSGKSPQPYKHLLLQILVGLMGVYYENKSFFYHYARFMFAATPIIAIGLIDSTQVIRSFIIKVRPLIFLKRWVSYGLLALVIAMAFLYSPLVKLWKQSVPFAAMQIKHKDVSAEVEHNMPGYYYAEQQQVADSLGPLLHDRDEVFFWGGQVRIYFVLNRLPTTMCLTSLPLFTPGATPASWQKNVLDSLRSSPPRFIIAQFDDFETALEGIAPLPWANIENWHELYSLVKENYTENKPIGHFRIFERKQ